MKIIATIKRLAALPNQLAALADGLHCLACDVSNLTSAIEKQGADADAMAAFEKARCARRVDS